jgi:hypothetical protein
VGWSSKEGETGGVVDAGSVEEVDGSSPMIKPNVHAEDRAGRHTALQHGTPSPGYTCVHNV